MFCEMHMSNLKMSCNMHLPGWQLISIRTADEALPTPSSTEFSVDSTEFVLGIFRYMTFMPGNTIFDAFVLCRMHQVPKPSSILI